MTKYVTHSKGSFDNDCAFFRIEGNSVTLVRPDGGTHEATSAWNLDSVLNYVADGVWKFITKAEADKLLILKPKYNGVTYIIHRDGIWNGSTVYLILDGNSIYNIDSHGVKTTLYHFTRDEVIGYLNKGLWKEISKAEAEKRLKPKTFTFAELETTAPAGTYAQETTWKPSRLHVWETTGKRAVLWVDSYGKTMEQAQDCWKRYKYVKVNDLKLNISFTE